MANRTDAKAIQVHGSNPQGLVDQIVRNRIYSCLYWKEKLAGVNGKDFVAFFALKISFLVFFGFFGDFL